MNKNEVERGSLQHPVPIQFGVPSWEIPEVKDDKHAVKVKVNEDTGERGVVYHGGVTEAYLHYVTLTKSLMHKRDLCTTSKGYKKEDSNMWDDLEFHDIPKPLADDPDKEVSKKKKEKGLSKLTMLQPWMK